MSLALVAAVVAVLDEQAAGDLADLGLAERGQAALLVLEDADVLLLGEDLERVVVVAGRDQHLDELLVQRLGGGACRPGG